MLKIILSLNFEITNGLKSSKPFSLANHIDWGFGCGPTTITERPRIIYTLTKQILTEKSLFDFKLSERDLSARFFEGTDSSLHQILQLRLSA